MSRGKKNREKREGPRKREREREREKKSEHKYIKTLFFKTVVRAHRALKKTTFLASA